jgi:hypothetical protein
VLEKVSEGGAATAATKDFRLTKFGAYAKNAKELYVVCLFGIREVRGPVLTWNSEAQILKRQPIHQQ